MRVLILSNWVELYKHHRDEFPIYIYVYVEIILKETLKERYYDKYNGLNTSICIGETKITYSFIYTSLLRTKYHIIKKVIEIRSLFYPHIKKISTNLCFTSNFFWVIKERK